MAALVIEDGGFRLEEVEIGSPFFDLYGRKKVQHKDGTSTIEWKILGYGLTIESALNKIILCRMSARNSEVLNLKQFFEAYKSERLETIKAFGLQTINLTKDLLKLKEELNENK